jgi:hypothetical protein
MGSGLASEGSRDRVGFGASADTLRTIDQTVSGTCHRLLTVAAAVSGFATHQSATSTGARRGWARKCPIRRTSSGHASAPKFAFSRVAKAAPMHRHASALQDVAANSCRPVALYTWPPRLRTTARRGKPNGCRSPELHVDLDLVVDLNDDATERATGCAGVRPGPRRRPGRPAKRDLHPSQTGALDRY